MVLTSAYQIHAQKPELIAYTTMKRVRLEIADDCA
jgi:hypothetical protein